MYRILIVDDESGIRSSLKGVLSDEGYSVEAAATGEECLERLGGGDFDLVLLDVWLPGIDGIETLRRVQERLSPPPVIMISGHATIATAVSATKLGAYDFLEKPLSIDHTLLTIRNALAHRRLEARNLELRREIESRYKIVGDSIPV